MAQINYTITKTGEENGTGLYEMRYTYDTSSPALVQKDEMIFRKEDASGEVAEERVAVPAASIVSYSAPNSTTPTKQKYNGFAVNVSDSNLAVGGVYYEVESTFGTYVNPNASSGSGLGPVLPGVPGGGEIS